ncbi:MAG: hypothetical protein FWD46_08705 [Cystobacterineae bacterium]|nr:hypothetical protein [Cystobacterineae bacterium]
MSFCVTLVAFLLAAPEGWNAQAHAQLEEAVANAEKQAEARWLQNKKPSELGQEERQALRQEKAAAIERTLEKHGKTFVGFEKEKLSLNEDQRRELQQAQENLRKQKEEAAVEAAVREALSEDSLSLVQVETPSPAPPPPPKTPRRGHRH